MNRRAFIAGLGSAAAWPVVARGRQSDRMRRVGILMALSEDDPQGKKRVSALREALADLGWTEGSNLKVDWRWTGGDIARTREYAAELVRLAPEVILANGTPAVAALSAPASSR